MVSLAKGKLSYYVLSCLAERDMYGLELIEQIKSKFGVEIKLPSLYSNINRMKELKFISTYLKESTKGPKCSYSSITEKGRQELENLRELWAKDDLLVSAEKNEPKLEEKPAETPASVTTEENYDDYFSIPDENEEEHKDFLEVPKDEPIINKPAKVEEPIEEKKEELFSTPQEPKEEKITSSYTKNIEEIKQISELKEEYFQNTDTVKEQKDDYAQFTENKKLFDITQDFSKYKKRKSFTENQMVMNVNNATKVDEDKKQSDISSLKQTIMNSKDGNYEPIDRFAIKEEEKKEETTISQNIDNKYQKLNEETKDDGLFITERIPQNEIPKAQKIEMSKLSFTIQNNFTKMPAPNRNSSLDPSCSDVKARLQKLYEKTSSKEPKEEQKGGFREYETLESLKDYYSSQDIDFKIYDKPEGRVRHNTNKLRFIAELMLFGLVGIASLIFYFIFNAVGGIDVDRAFLYYLFPIIAFVVVAYRFYDYKFGVSRVPRSMLKTLVVWIIFALGSVAIFCFSIVCGLNLRLAGSYCTCIIYPIIIYGIYLVARHYITLWLYKRYWR